MIVPVEARRVREFPLEDREVIIGLVLCVLLVYARVAAFGFINFDDREHVYNNPYVRSGLSLAGIRWAFTAIVVGNWIPLTMLSHMLDVQLFGLRSGWHHLANVCYHAAAAAVLYKFLRAATASRGLPAFAAFVFALHPLHVESVAWIAERKDVLSGLLAMLTLYAYVAYVQHPGRRRYWITLGLFSLGLMAKPMLMTLPLILLLLDLWPLERQRTWKLLWEKLPFFVLALADGIITVLVQGAAGAVKPAPLDLRLANAVNSYVIYLWQTVWPARLAVIYPFPKVIVGWHAGIGLLAIVTVSVISVLQFRKRPYLTVGWFWFIGMLLPVIGLIRFGAQAHADRYMYLPMIGLTLAVGWGVSEMMGRRPRFRTGVAVAAAIACCAFAVMSYLQVGYWRNGETVFTHAIEVNRDNYVAHTGLAEYLVQFPQRETEAVQHLDIALQINPDYPEAHSELGIYLARLNLCDAAIPHFEAVLHVQPQNLIAGKDLGLCLAQTGRYDAAIRQFEKQLQIGPDDSDIRFALGDLLSKYPGREANAIAHYEAGLRLNPSNTDAHSKLASLLERMGRPQEAADHRRAAEQFR